MKTVTLKYLSDNGFRPVNTNMGKIKDQVIGTMLTTKDGRLYSSEIHARPQRTKGLCLKVEIVYGEPRLVEGFKVVSKK